MTPEDIQLVRATFAQVVPIKAEAAGLFYGRLFEIAPQVKPLFRGEMREQGAKLMAAIGFVVASLDRLDEILPEVGELARRHVAYGVEATHYEPVGEALIWTLRQGLGGTFTAATELAWRRAYAVLSGAMIAAATDPALAA